MPADPTTRTGRPAGLVVRPLTRADAEQIATWQYGGQWHVYSSRPEDGLVTGDSGFQAVADSGTGDLVGYVCVGAEARVPSCRTARSAPT
jgi:hypothetical protein